MFLSKHLLLICFGLAYGVSPPFKAILNYFTNRKTGTLNGFLCNFEDGMELLRAAVEDNTTKVTVSGMVKTKEVLHGLNIFHSKHFKTGTFFDFRCNTPKKVFLEVCPLMYLVISVLMAQGLMLNTTNIILIYATSVDDAFSFMERADICFDSEVALLGNGEIYDLYKIHKSLPLKHSIIGSWNGSDLILRDRSPRDDLNSIEIKGMVVLTNLQLQEKDREQQLLNYTLDPQLDVLSRYAFTVHKHLEKMYNFRIAFNTTNDWGYYRKSLGHWDPGTMFRAIELGEVDLGLSSSRIFAERLDISFFIPPIKKFRTCFIFKHPSTLAVYTAFALPFSKTTWACTFCIVLLAGMLLRFIRNFKIKDNPPNEASFFASILLVIGTMCQQGLYVDSLRLSTRVLCIFLELTSLLIYSFYGAEVVGFLLTPTPKNINTLDKLIDSPIKLFSENLSYHRTHFTGNFSEKVTKAYNMAIKGPSPNKDKFINLTIGLKRVQNGGVALYGQDTNLYTVIEKTFSNSEKCALSEIDILLMWTSTVIRKKSPFKELTYKGIMIVRESGLMLREDRKWHAQRPACLGQEESGAVKLEATLIAQVIYICGLLFAILFYLAEKHIENRKGKSVNFSFNV